MPPYQLSFISHLPAMGTDPPGCKPDARKAVSVHGRERPAASLHSGGTAQNSQTGGLSGHLSPSGAQMVVLRVLLPEEKLAGDIEKPAHCLLAAAYVR